MVENRLEIIKDFIENTNCLDNFDKGKNWSFDLRVGDEYFVSGNDIPIKLTDEKPYIIIKPGQFAILETQEVVKLDNKHIALISVKFSFKKKGLINVSGFHVDPNYKGKIIFTVFNAGPNDIYIKRGEYVFMIFFLRLEQALERKTIEGYKDGIPTDIFANLGGGALTLMEYNKKIEQLEFYMKVIVIPIAILFVSFLLKKFLG